VKKSPRPAHGEGNTTVDITAMIDIA